MPLTQEDISRIEALGFTDFYEVVDGYRILKNVDGHCIFLTPHGCSIYPYRPEGCRYYPFILEGDRVVVDSEYCPYSEEFVAMLNERIEEGLRRLVDRIEEERQEE